jgi:hypothetical protein
VPSSINPLFTMAMGGFNVNDANSAQHSLSLDIIAQLSAAMRNKTPHVQNNRITFNAATRDLQDVVERHLCPLFELDTMSKADQIQVANNILTDLENAIVERQNPYDESRNLGLFLPSVAIPPCDVRLPEFLLSDILQNLVPVRAENDENECVWGKMCTTLTHGSQLTFRTRDCKRRPLKKWTTPNDDTCNTSGMCLLCEVVHANGIIRAYQRIGRAPPWIIQKFKVACDPEIGLPADALLFPDASFNGLIAPFINADWLFAHLIPPAEDSSDPYRILRGYFSTR